MLLGNDQTCEADLLGQLLPEVSIEAVLGRHLCADSLFVGLVSQKLAYRRAKFFVFVGKALHQSKSLSRPLEVRGSA